MSCHKKNFVHKKKEEIAGEKKTGKVFSCEKVYKPLAYYFLFAFAVADADQWWWTYCVHFSSFLSNHWQWNRSEPTTFFVQILYQAEKRVIKILPYYQR